VAEREFTIECLDSNVIIVDGKEYNHTVRDLARFYALLQESLSTTSTVPGKPALSGPQFKHACNFCPLKKVCEVDRDLAQHMHMSREALLNREPPRSFKIAHNTERRKKNRQAKKEKQ